MGEKLRVGVLVSGGGTNLQAIIDACARQEFPARLVVVGSNKPDAYGLERARRAGIPTFVESHRGHASREEHERAMIGKLAPHRVELLALAGYMRVVTPVLIGHFHDEERGLPGVINIHPADTREYQGAHGYEYAMGLLEEHPRRLEQTKITVHFVDAGVDTGPVIAQEPVPVHPEDSLDDLRARGLEVEHRLYPRVIRWYAQGRLRLQDNQVTIEKREEDDGGQHRS